MSRATIMKIVIIGAVLVVVFVGVGMLKGKKGGGGGGGGGGSAPPVSD